MRGLPVLILPVIILLAAFTATPAFAAGHQTCRKAYEDAAENYWSITSDMMRFKALFDNYNDLCRKYYPAEIKKLQPDADTLLAQVAQDAKNITPVMTRIFNTVLPGAVPEKCAKDKKSRDTIRRAFLGSLKERGKTMGARMKKSGKTVKDPENTLKLCRDLGTYAPLIRDKLGPGLAAPLLTLTEMNQKYMVGDGNKLKDALAVYRRTLGALNKTPKSARAK